MRVLIAAEKLIQFAGAEMVALELVEHCLAGGQRVTVATIASEHSMRMQIDSASAGITHPATLRLGDFDTAWLKHGLGLLLADIAAPPTASTLTMPVSLSPVRPLTRPPAAFSAALADVAVANSEETACAASRWDRTILRRRS